MSKKVKLKPKKVKPKSTTTKKLILRKDGFLQNYNVKVDDLKVHRPIRTKSYSVQPSKGGGVALLGKGRSNYKEGLEKLKQIKKEPSDEIVKYIGDNFIDIFKDRFGENELNSITDFVIPPVTSGKDVTKTLNYKVAKYMGEKLNKKVHDDFFGNKDFEMKHLGNSEKIKRFQELMENVEPDFSTLGDYPVLVDDIMTTGTTNKEIANKFKKAGKKYNSMIIFKNG